MENVYESIVNYLKNLGIDKGFDITFESDNNSFSIIGKRNSKSQEFMEKINSLDDDVFQEAVDKFSETYSVQEFNNKLASGTADKEIEEFNKIVADIINSKIEHLKSYL